LRRANPNDQEYSPCHRVLTGKAISSSRSSRIALHAACASSERISFRQINRKTGNRLRQQLVDEETREPIDGHEKARGYEIGKGQSGEVEVGKGPDTIVNNVPDSPRIMVAKLQQSTLNESTMRK
jgi:hypothetical protein